MTPGCSSRPSTICIALIFVVFDVEAIFIFPWAIAYNKLGLYALVEMVLFVAILFGGLLYAWKKEALEWH